MPDELIDLTKLRPRGSELWAFDKTDAIILLTTGGVGYLAKEALKYFFPGTPSITEQIDALSKLVEASGHAGATSLKVRISNDARWHWEMPKSIVDAKFVHETPNTVDLEILFRQRHKRKTREA
jgi:hypothetical protein